MNCFGRERIAAMENVITPMPHVESIWLYPTSPAEVNTWLVALSTPTATTNRCPWPTLKTLVLRNTSYEDDELMTSMTQALEQREAHGCSRLERLVVSRSIISKDRISLLRPFAEQLVAFANATVTPPTEVSGEEVYDELEPLLRL